MKFGKTYMDTIASPSFPQEWKDGAIEYKHLKKLINGVVAELESLGLGADVLRELIEGVAPPERSGTEDSSDAEGDENDPDKSHVSITEGPTHGGSEPMAISTPSSLLASFESAPIQSSHSRSLEAANVLTSSPQRVGRELPTTRSDPPLSPLAEGVETRNSARARQVRSSSDASAAKREVLSRSESEQTRSSRSSSTASSTPAAEWVSSFRDAAGNDMQANVAGSSERGRADKPDLLHPARRRHSEHKSDDVVDPHGSNSKPRRPSERWEGVGLGRKDLEAIRRRASEANGGDEGSAGSSRSASASRSTTQDGRHDWGGHAWREKAKLQWDEEEELRNKTARAREEEAARLATQSQPRWVQGKGGRRARAEYELGGTPEHPIPRIRLYVESPIHTDDEDSDDDERDEDGAPHMPSFSEEATITEMPDSPHSSAGGSTIRWVPDASAPPPPEESLPEPAIDPLTPTPGSRGMRRRQVVIPLSADTAFLDTLTGALSNLSALQDLQRSSFITSTENLCASVARVASPYASKSDLYVWREIFSVWVEMQIFESEREKDRGELSVDESEARLKRFVEEMTRRGWAVGDLPIRGSDREDVEAEIQLGDTERAGGATKKGLFKRSKKVPGTADSTSLLPMKDSASVSTLESFLQLNLALLDVKKFQRVNVEAARKILKKHDKRTALTASADLRAFMQAASEAGLPGNMDGMSIAGGAGDPLALTRTHPSLAALLPSSTTGLLSESLPHILLSLVTTTLLPILPSIDDYSCAICTSVAWRPIRLDCTHLFCIRCLVKLQRAGKADCPLCRRPRAVETADAKNLDIATKNLLRSWFPDEVKEKDKSNESERHKEEIIELGFHEEKCVIA